MSALALPRPDNVRVPHGASAHLVESDVYGIAERMKELDPNLYLYALDPPVKFGPHTYHWAVCEFCGDGRERLVKRFEALDARVISDLQYMLRVPFEKRLEEAEKLEAKAEAERKANELDELYERMGGQMWHDLERCGFIQRPVSYAKRGIRK